MLIGARAGFCQCVCVAQTCAGARTRSSLPSLSGTASRQRGFLCAFTVSQGKPEVSWQLAGVIRCWDQLVPGSGIPSALGMYWSRWTNAPREWAASRLSIPWKKTTRAESLEMYYFMAVFNSDTLEVNLLGSYTKIPVFSRATGTPRLKEKTANGFAAGEAAFAGSAVAKNWHVQKLDRVLLPKPSLGSL